MMRYGRKFAVAVLGMLLITLLGIREVNDVGTVVASIAGIVLAFCGAHAVQDNANAKAGRAGG